MTGPTDATNAPTTNAPTTNAPNAPNAPSTTNAPTANIWTTTAVAASQVAQDTPAGEAVTFRADVLAMTQTAEDAVLRPAEPGRWPHALRAALACRIARHNKASELAERYRAMIGPGDYAAIADPASPPASPDLPADAAAYVRFVDRVATNPRDIAAEDVKALQDAGVADGDIVRLSELNAFVAYQIRLAAGLALLAEVRP